jgi:VWFA-related protein
VSQSVDTVTLESLPLSVTLALDTSQSVSGGRLDHLIEASRGIMDALRPDDRAALVTFSHAVDLRVPMTGNLATIRAALGRITGDGATALRDAVHLALETCPRDRSRPLVLLFTDGHDTVSWLTEDAVVDTAKHTAVVVHVVQLESDGFLNRLAEATGGRTWSATSDRQLRDLFTRALDEMRARYLLTYTPAGQTRPGWHDVKVRVKNQRADITARPGYYVQP